MDRYGRAREVIIESGVYIDFLEIFERYEDVTEDEAYDIARLIETAIVDVRWSDE